MLSPHGFQRNYCDERALIAQQNGYADVDMGTGTVIIPLSSHHYWGDAFQTTDPHHAPWCPLF